MQRHVDRLHILLTERNEIIARRAQVLQTGDQAAIARTDADLVSINREIAQVSKAPVVPVSFAVPAKKPAAAKPESAVIAAVSESQPAPSEPTTYESWDVFKNFGRKGNQP